MSNVDTICYIKQEGRRQGIPALLQQACLSVTSSALIKDFYKHKKQHLQEISYTNH